MANLLSVPFKRTYPTNVKDAAKSWLQEHSTAHPDAFKADINRWQDLRNDAVGGVLHVDRINSALKYHAQLASILTKLPPDINLDIAYAPVFSPTAVPVSLKSLVFERASVVFNLASLYSQLAESEDRSHMDGIKRAIAFYQNAAGTLSFLRTSVLPKFTLPSDEEDIPLDLAPEFIRTVEQLMLSQAQECVWQKAKLDNFKNGLMARLAASTASLYQHALTTARDAPASVRNIFPFQWLSHIEAKRYHFEAVAQYRKSLDEFEASKSDTAKYGIEIARLQQSLANAQKAYDISRKGKVHPTVVQDAQSLLDVVRKSLTRAERDNDLIYHQEVPPLSALPPIAHAAIAQLTVPPGLMNPTSIIDQDEVVFGELMGWGAQEAINIYNDRKQNLMEEKIDHAAKHLKQLAESTLRSLNLPASLEALERRVGLPPSLLRKAEEVRLEDGPSKIESALGDLHQLAETNMNILNEAMDILDSEASEDENLRRETFIDRPPSHEANVEFIEKQARYRTILEQARSSDQTIQQKWDEWEKNIIELTWDEAELEASVPSSTFGASSSAGTETQKHARTLRSLLESLDALERDCNTCVRRCQAVFRADDIQPRILKAASGLQRLVGVEPKMFEDVMDEELAKYDKFILDLQELATKQETILASIKSHNDEFLKSRKEDPSVKEREHALQSLDLSYHKYREIVQNLQEGVKFYNDLAVILNQFKDSCKTWSQARKQEIRLNRPHKTSQEQLDPPSKLPALNSADWGFEDLVPLAPPRKKK